jgi:hypothetical protein
MLKIVIQLDFYFDASINWYIASLKDDKNFINIHPVQHYEAPDMHTCGFIQIN